MSGFTSCHCEECQHKHDDFLKRFTEVKNFLEELTINGGVVPSKMMAKPMKKKYRSLKKLICRSLSKIKRRKISSPDAPLPVLALTDVDYASTSKGKEKEVRLANPFEGYPITGQGPTQLMSSFSEWIQQGLLMRHAQKGSRDEHYKANFSKFEFEELDFIIAFPMTKNWFYVMSQPNKCWNDEHVDVIFYYLRKQSKLSNSILRRTTATCFLKTYIDEDAKADYEERILNIIKGFSTSAGLPWHLTDEVYLPVNCDGLFHWVLTVIVLKERCIKVYDLMYSSKNIKMHREIVKIATMLPKYLVKTHFFEKKDRTDWSALECYKKNKKSDPFEVKYITGIPQQASSSLDCGLFVAAYAEFLIDGLQVPSSGIVAESLRMRYASLLWNYGFMKAQNGYVSDNEETDRVRRPKPKLIVADANDVVDIE